MMRLATLLLVFAGFLNGAPLDVRLPTANQHLLSGEPEQFYMHVDRTFEGETSKPWEGGSFGLVRTPRRVDGGMILTQFHEGIDIAPVERDRAGNPLDLVSSIADGTVVHANTVSGRSNYGKYVVVEHRWEDSSVFSLYAHLAEITCKPGDVVKVGAVLGRMGYTGVGVNRTRAHLHLELAVLMSARYEDWNKFRGYGPNHHGNFNGLNLAGVEVARFFVEHAKNPDLKFSEFVAATPVYFKVTAPAKGALPLVTRYPWMLHGNAAGAISWEVSFSATGQPLAVAPSQRRVPCPIITQIQPSEMPHRYLTRGLVVGEGNKASLSQSGKNLVALLTDDFPATAVTATSKTAQ